MITNCVMLTIMLTQKMLIQNQREQEPMFVAVGQCEARVYRNIYFVLRKNGER